MTPPRLRLRLVDPLETVPEDSPVRVSDGEADWRTLATDAAAANPGTEPPVTGRLDEPTRPVPTDSTDHRGVPVPTDSTDHRGEPVPTDSTAHRGEPVPTDSTPHRGVPVPTNSHSALVLHPQTPRPDAHAPVPTDSLPATHDPAAALAELDRLLADPTPPDDPTCERLAALAGLVPGRQRQVTAALARATGSAAIGCLRALPPATPGLLEALLACFARGAPRLPPVPGDMPAPLLALEFRGSRARGFPDLVARAQAIAQASPAAEFAALDLEARRHYRLTFWPDRCPTAALAAQLRAGLPDLTWLHGRLLRLRGSQLWLAGWRFDADDPLGPAAQARLLHVWLRGWLDRARESAA